REQAARQQQETAARARAERHAPAGRQQKSWLEKTVQSATFRDQVLRTGGQILRDALGTARRR
ncbi:MAG: ATP-binding protein, partial [Propionicimonas sp.]|nr:ATP-binding protein [Propionicimonas sp.]MEA5054353.1 ATP-binding protein [Propionicimonas sp.]